MKRADFFLPFFAAAGARSRDELAFLPAALEIVETPPPPLAGAVGGIVVALFCAALAWATLGSVDIVASAPGKIVSAGRIKTIQPFETGVVREIRVRDGQAVKAGEILIKLDPTINAAERDRLSGELVAAELDIARLSAALGGDDPLAAFRTPAGASEDRAQTQRRLLSHQLEEQAARLAGLDRQKAQKEAELATTLSSIGRLEAVLPVLGARVEIREVLYSRQTGSKAAYLELYQTLVDMRQELAVQKSRVAEAQAAIATVVETRAQAQAEYRRKLFGELAEAQRKAAALREDLVKATQRAELQLLTAPVDGVVQQLAAHTVGGVVTPGQALLALAPAREEIEIEAMVSNRDIGFVRPGQTAETKIDAFPFTRYGLVHGRIVSLSQDAVVRRKGEGAALRQPATEDGASEPEGEALVYAARIALDRTQMRIDDNLVNLSPGMAATVEIRTGSRRIIDYLLSPLMRYGHDSLRER